MISYYFGLREFTVSRRRKPVSFRISEVSCVVGASRRQLAYWDKTGLVSPSLRSASGRGSRRLYSTEDILELKILMRLLHSSLPLQRIRPSFRFIRGQSKSLASLIVLTDGKTVYFYQDENVLVDTLKQGQTVLRIAVQDLISEIQATLTNREGTNSKPT
jgi:DNA-binding transcriptional MerR regulator